MIVSQVQSLKDQFVIFKKVSGTPYFFRGERRNFTNSAKSAGRLNKTEADTLCKKLNEARKGKGYKLWVAPAEKYLVNTFSWSLYDGGQLFIRNDFIPTKWVTAGQGRKPVHSLNDLKNNLTKDMESAKNSLKVGAKKLLDETKQKIQNIEKKISDLESLRIELENTDVDKQFIEPVLSSTDRTVSVLYGSKTNP